MAPESESYLMSVEKQDRYDLAQDEMTVGRTAVNELHFNFPEISSKHAVLLRKQDPELDIPKWSVNDLGSTNGTYVNGEKVTQETALNNGDRIKFGCKEYMLHCPEPPVIEPEIDDQDFDKTMVFGDAADDATGGCLLSMLAALGGSVGVGYIAPQKSWLVRLWVIDRVERFEGATLAEAAARALLEVKR